MPDGLGTAAGGAGEAAAGDRLRDAEQVTRRNALVDHRLQVRQGLNRLQCGNLLIEPDPVPLLRPGAGASVVPDADDVGQAQVGGRHGQGAVRRANCAAEKKGAALMA